MPHLVKIKRLVRLLLEIKTDFLPLPFALIASLSASLRHSGIEASIDGVASGSRTSDRVRALRGVKAAHSISFPIEALRGPTKNHHDTSISCNTIRVMTTSSN